MTNAIPVETPAIFARDGVVCIRNLLSQDWIEKLRDAVEEVMTTPGEMSRDLAEEGGSTGKFYSEVFASRRNDVLRDFIHQSRIAEAASRAMGSREIKFFNDHLLVKEPGTNAETLWHQDYPYFPCEGTQVCSVWLGLDPVTRETGAMSFVRGSHTAGKLYAPQNFSSGVAYSDEGYDGPPPDVDADPQSYPTICYELAPGDVTIHHARTLHGAKGNSSLSTRRRGYTVRLTGDDVVWRKQGYMPRGFVDLDDGAPLSGPRYPLLWREGLVA